MYTCFTGLEFTAQKKFLKDQGVNLFHTQTGIKATFAERAIQTILSKVHKQMYLMNTPKWINLISDIQNSYNHTKSASLLGFSPKQILENKSASRKLGIFYAQQRLKHHQKYEKRKPIPLTLGTHVRTIRPKQIFDKTYLPAFSDKVYKIIHVKHSTVPEQYTVNDGSQRAFYREELSEVRKDANSAQKNLYIGKTRKVRPKATRSGRTYHDTTQYQLKSIQDPKFSMWIEEKELKDLQSKKLLQ